jgi:hypothetical protein
MNHFTHIATLTYPSELVVIKSLLESENIECYVKDELTVQVHNFYSNAIGGISLEVPNNHVKKAITILTDNGFENYLTFTHQEFMDGPQEQKVSKTLKYAIGIIVTASLILILIVIILFIYHG